MGCQMFCQRVNGLSGTALIFSLSAEIPNQKSHTISPSQSLQAKATPGLSILARLGSASQEADE
jgi:hypothetical protein